MLRELETATNAVLAEESANTPAFNNVLDSQRAFAMYYMVWK
jgi:TRAP-type mannitol/chloroaromatic compound transport system substrate-binding protein